MKSMLLAAAAAFALVPLGTAAIAEPPAIPRLNYKSRTLPNGLKVYSLRDPTSANVSVQVWYDVGSRDDPRGRSGFAHLFEHLMFKSTRNLVPEQFDRLTEDVGGYITTPQQTTTSPTISRWSRPITFSACFGPKRTGCARS